MRRFELTEGASSKFWEVALADADVTVRFGRIGTQGQTRTKSFASAAAAQKEHDALIKEKTGKGYREVGLPNGSTLMPPVPSPAVLPAKEPEPAESSIALPTAACIEPAAPMAASTIDWPEGGFQWSDELLEAMPVVRGIHAPSPIDGRALLAEPIVFGEDPHGLQAEKLAALAAAVNAGWSRWDARASVDMIRADRLQRADPAFWLELCAQCWSAIIRPGAQVGLNTTYGRHGLTWVTWVGIALHGLPFMIEVALAFARAVQPHKFNLASIVIDQFGPLRQAIAAAGDAEHDAAIATLERAAGSTAFDRLLRAWLCPHRTDWAMACLADNSPTDLLLLSDCVVPVEAMRGYLRRTMLSYHSLEGTLVLQLRLHDAGAFDLLADLLRRAVDRESSEKLTALVLRMQVPQSVSLLVELVGRKEVRAALDSLAERYPAAALKCMIEHAITSRSRFAEGWAVRLALREPAAWAQASLALRAAHRERFQALLDALQGAQASHDRLPPLLRDPPWLRKARASELPTLQVPARTTVDRIAWTPEEKARYAALRTRPWRLECKPSPEEHALDEMQITPAGGVRVMNGEPLQPGDVVISKPYFYGTSPEALMVFPEAAALAIWNSYPGKHWFSGDNEAPIRWMLARHGEKALPGLVAFAQSQADAGLTIAQAVDCAGLVPIALHALRNLKKAKAAAIAWLRAHPATAVTAALPLAFGRDKTQRDLGQFGLRWFVANGFDALVRDIAAGYGAQMSQALQALLDADPLLVLPARMPRLPAFFVAPSFRRPVLREGGQALPASAVEHIGMMLAISKLEAPYPGLALVKEACTPGSLAEFAWDLFEAWIGADAPSKDAWAFAALGLLGDDETARRLAPCIREWPGEAAHQRAVTGLDLLAAIGTDAALMHLNGIAGKVKFKALQDRAKEKIAAVAQARGFSAAELADRLVPDLGLDGHGTLQLNFGSRQFFVSFDETLKPFVKDAQGVRLKDLPKPNRSDDAALADAATDRYKQLKKDAKAIASLQVARLEMGMVERRRWSAPDFRQFFLEHPLMRHLVARLVWGAYDAQGTLASAFRVAEDWTLADAEDALMELTADMSVGIVHVIEMPPGMQTAFGQIFADYEILQPFKQLGREIHRLTPEELKRSEITRYENKVVATGSVMGLVNRGWERGAAQDAGWVGWFSKRVGDGLEVQLELDPGLAVGYIDDEPKQRIPKIVLRQAGSWDEQGQVNFERLDPILASEVLRDAELLAPFKE